MLHTEYVRNCNCNYERMHLDKKPEENRYQYCILSRGGIRYLLPASLRYINGEAYLYYDISSTQSASQLFTRNCITRAWMQDFLWGIKQLCRELDRFLLEEQNIIWYPEHIFQDMEKNDFSFLYVPYYEENNGLDALADFLVEKVDYADDALVEFVYEIYEQLKSVGTEYLHQRIHDDWEASKRKQKEQTESGIFVESVQKEQKAEPLPTEQENVSQPAGKESGKWGIKLFKENRRKKNIQRDTYREAMRQKINGLERFAVCEDSPYEKQGIQPAEETEVFSEEYGKTIYIEETIAKKEPALYKTDGELAAKMDKSPFVIGKKKENVDLALNDYSVSRIHARITQEEGGCYVEDLNSTNGTFKNGLRLNPYEKRKLEQGDELRFGQTEFIYR